MVYGGQPASINTTEKSLLGLCLGLLLLVFLVRTETVSAHIAARSTSVRNIVQQQTPKAKQPAKKKNVSTIHTDTIPKNEAATLTEKIRRVKSHSDSLAANFSLLEINPDDEGQGLQVKAVQKNKDTFSYRLSDGKRSDVSLNGKAVAPGDSSKYHAAISNIEDAIRYRDNAKAIQKELFEAVKQEANLQTQRKLEAMQQKQSLEKVQKLPHLTKLAPG